MWPLKQQNSKVAAVVINSSQYNTQLAAAAKTVAVGHPLVQGG